MAFLSNLFGSNESSTSDTESNSSSFLSDFDAALDINASSTSYESYSDGEESYETIETQEFGTSLDVGNLIDSMTDSFSDSDSTSFG